jgi:hypothetical protein
MRKARLKLLTWDLRKVGVGVPVPTDVRPQGDSASRLLERCPACGHAGLRMAPTGDDVIGVVRFAHVMAFPMTSRRPPEVLAACPLERPPPDG